MKIKASLTVVPCRMIRYHYRVERATNTVDPAHTPGETVSRTYLAGLILQGYTVTVVKGGKG